VTGIVVGSNESIDSALKRFKKQVEKGGVLSEIKKREFYGKPSQRKKKGYLHQRNALQNQPKKFKALYK
jgi:small subunit ribosomal protein S21